MYLALRVPFSLAGLIWTDVSLRAHPAELPPIFNPRPAISSSFAAPTSTSAGPPSRLSNRVRLLLNTASERVLAEAKEFELPVPKVDPALQSDSSTMPSPAAPVMLPRYIVKSTAPPRQEVHRPDLPPLRPYVVDREGRPGMVTGYTFPVWRSKDGGSELNLNLIDFAGRGVNHAKEFGRAEIEFKIRF